MRIYQSVTQNGGEFRVSLLTGSDLNGRNGPPRVQFGSAFDVIPLDEARKLARAILAIPRPIDAGPEEGA